MFLQGSKMDATQSVQSSYSAANKQLIIFHDPFKRLAARKIFQNKYNRLLSSLSLSADYFAIFDAIQKRGGLKTVSYKQKWNDIYSSLPYYKSKDMVAVAHQIYKQLKQNYRELAYKYDSILEGIQSYPLTPAMSNCSPYYKRTIAEEQIFRGGSFQNTDEYLNIKCIVSQTKFQIHHIPVEYRQKCILLRKWLIMFGFIQEKNYALNDIYGFNIKTDIYHVLIMGLSVPNLILAKRLTRFGINNTIFINQNQSNKSINELFQQAFIDIGILFFENGIQCPKYQELLNQGFQLQIIESLDRQTIAKRQFDKKKEMQLTFVKPDKLLNTFIAVLDQLSAQIHNKAPFLQEFQKKIKKIQQQISISEILMLDEVSLTLNYLIQKQMLLTKMKGEYTTVSQLRYWLKTTKNYKKAISCVITGWNSDCRINILKGPLKSISKKQKNWKLQYSDQTKNFSHLIFGNTSSILKSINKRDYKIENGVGEMFQQGFPVLQQLGYQQFVHLALKFNQLKQNMIRFNMLGIQNQKLGWVFIFFNFQRKTILVFSRIVEARKNSYSLQDYKRIMIEIVEKCLGYPNFKQHLSGPPFCKISTTFFMKDQRFIDYLLLAREQQKMYFNLPVITSMHPQKLQSQTELCKSIQGKILLEIFDCKFYDLRALQKFIDKEIERQKKPIFQKPEASENQQKNINDIAEMVHKTSSLNSPNTYLVQENQLYRLPKDCFGLDHPVVYKHILFVRKQFENAFNENHHHIKNEDIDDILRRIAPLEIMQPIQLYPSTKLIKLGHFQYLQHIQGQALTYLPKETKNVMSCFLLADYIVKREGISFFYGLNIKTNFFQYLLAINGHQYYVIVDQEFPQYLFFHRQLKDLLQFVQVQTNQILISSNSYTKTQKLLSKQQLIPDNLLPDRIKQKIMNEINELKKIDNESLSLLLKRKIEIFKHGMNKTGAKLFQSSLQISPKSCVINEVNRYLNYQARINRLKPLSLFDLMIGKLDIYYLIAEMIGVNFRDRTEKKIKTLKDIMDQDKQLCLQIEQVLASDYSKAKRYNINMAFDKGLNIKNVLNLSQPFIPSITTFTREFLCKFSTSPKTIFYEFSITDFINPRSRKFTKRLMHYITIKQAAGFNSQFIQNDSVVASSQNVETLMENFTEILLVNWTIQQIITAYKQLIDDEISMTHQFPKILKNYHKMTRIRNYSSQHMHIPSEIKQKIFEEKLNSKQQKILIEAIQSSKLFFTAEGGIICAL